ncbi:hypothetical protein V500_09290 [Pseudogymnoascus sp. VKM F-4518 (FW-2643)]|nr:hypothetical protein V500_09290 [Pseudogymnoascus sp. VKM F-4518 (FW-2643)]
MGDIGWSPVDGWASGPGRNPRRGSYRPDEPGRHRGPPGGTFLPRAPMPLGFGPSPQMRPLHPQGFMPRGFGPPPRMRPHPGRDFGSLSDENHYDIEFSRFQRGPPPPPYSSSHGLRDFADMVGDLDLDRRGSSGSSKGGNGSHGIDRDRSRVSETPVTFPLSPSGKKIHCIIDTGASMTLVKRSALRRYFPNISVTRGVGITMSGISGKGDSTDERIMLPLTFIGERGESIRAQGEAWIVEGKHLDTDILLGLPFMRDNGMHLQWGGGAGRRSGGDHIACRGSRIPISIDSQG